MACCYAPTIHTLLDLDLIMIDPAFRIKVSYGPAGADCAMLMGKRMERPFIAADSISSLVLVLHGVAQGQPA